MAYCITSTSILSTSVIVEIVTQSKSRINKVSNAYTYQDVQETFCIT